MYIFLKNIQRQSRQKEKKYIAYSIYLHYITYKSQLPNPWLIDNSSKKERNAVILLAILIREEVTLQILPFVIMNTNPVIFFSNQTFRIENCFQRLYETGCTRKRVVKFTSENVLFT